MFPVVSPQTLRSRLRVLLITLDRVGEQMTGPAIRCWELAHVLSPHVDVTLATVALGPLSSPDVELLEFAAHSPGALREHIMRADAIIAQPQWPVISGWMHRSGARVIYDLYDPEAFETIELFADRRPLERRLWVELTLDRLQDALRGGHHFLCASEKQRDLWLGAMYGQRLIGATAYDRDPSFRSVIDVVPFGLPAKAAPATAGESPIRAALPAIGPDDEIVLWNGGIWNWLDPVGAVRAFALLRARRPRARLVFMGASDLPAARRATQAARAEARESGQLDRTVFFNDRWVPYAERAQWLRHAACAVATHREHLETRFAFRTRLLDCFWTGLPVVCTAGDELADRVQRERLGEAVAPGDDTALAAALERVLAAGRASYASALETVAAEYAWPRVAAPLVDFVLDGPPPGPLASRGRRAWRRESGHQLRSVAYGLSHDAIYRAFAIGRRVRGRDKP